MTQQTQTYFNLLADGFGFLNRLREVQPKRGKAFYACTIQAARGDADDKSRFDVRIVGDDAKKLVERLFTEYPELLSSDWKKRPTISCAFRVGDIQPVVFETTDRKTQEKIQTPSIDGRLLKFKFIKVDGKLWYSEKWIEIGSEHSSDSTEGDEATESQN